MEYEGSLARRGPGGGWGARGGWPPLRACARPPRLTDELPTLRYPPTRTGEATDCDGEYSSLLSTNPPTAPQPPLPLAP